MSAPATVKGVEFTHKGTTIKITPTGKFIATYNGQSLHAPSLEAMKKKIDQTVPFEPFEAFVVDSWRGGSIKHLRVIGIRPERGRYNGLRWVDKDGRTHDRVYRSTPENLERAQAYVDACDRHAAAVVEAEKLEAKLLDEIGDEVTAAEYKP